MCLNTLDIFSVEFQNCKYELSMITLFDTGFTTEEKEELKSHIDGYLLMFDVKNKFSLEKVKTHMKLILQLHDPTSPILAEMNKNSWQNAYKKKRKATENNASSSSSSTNTVTTTSTNSSNVSTPTLNVTDTSNNPTTIVSPSSPGRETGSISSSIASSPTTTSSTTSSVSSSTSQTILPVVIIGNKCDIPDEEREVETKEGLQLGDKLGCPFIETSATFKKKGIDTAFIELIKRIDRTREEKRRILVRSSMGSLDDNAIDRRKSISSIFSFVSVSTSDNAAADEYQQAKRAKEMRELRKQQLAQKQ
ncbi:predicted protein [Naegleria gruberi]|uniref:Predicted protein n=1 Tax=Naegleria gruberi TaxID=5762 RepID=D2VLX2_NAEGR|nr:uncharacterized protein NAEGRDRAFT_69930 [Naegleria gruberi]EFC42218.1 predicted protein [Naegleria gruberi]|eukprot:XP_002674962.1 predicted protein [Naegleria gruberi strain NEG-M]